MLYEVITAITAMYRENPGLDQYRKSVLTVECSENVTGMEDAVRTMVRLGVKILRGEEIETPADEGCFEQGIRKNFVRITSYNVCYTKLLRSRNRERRPGSSGRIVRIR